MTGIVDKEYALFTEYVNGERDKSSAKWFDSWQAAVRAAQKAIRNGTNSEDVGIMAYCPSGYFWCWTDEVKFTPDGCAKKGECRLLHAYDDLIQFRWEYSTDVDIRDKDGIIEVEVSDMYAWGRNGSAKYSKKKGVNCEGQFSTFTYIHKKILDTIEEFTGYVVPTGEDLFEDKRPELDWQTGEPDCSGEYLVITNDGEMRAMSYSTRLHAFNATDLTSRHEDCQIRDVSCFAYLPQMCGDDEKKVRERCRTTPRMKTRTYEHDSSAVDLYAKACQEFASDTADWYELDDDCWYVSNGGHWNEEGNGSYGIDVSWAFHESPEYIDYYAPEVMLGKLLEELQEAIYDECDLDQLQSILDTYKDA